MNLRTTSKLEVKEERLAAALRKCNLMLGSEVPQPEYVYFLELEKIGPGERYRRTWFYLDRLCQKDHSHIPEENEYYTKKVRRTRNHELCRLMYHRQGICVESESLEEEA